MRHALSFRNFSAALSVIANVGVFVMMGLLVFPSQWGSLWLEGILLFAALTLVARPVAVWLGTLGMRFAAKERLFMSWAGFLYDTTIWVWLSWRRTRAFAFAAVVVFHTAVGILFDPPELVPTASTRPDAAMPTTASALARSTPAWR